MATLLLSAAGNAIGTQIGGTLLGMTAAQIGAGIGTAVGGMIDSALLSGLTVNKSTGPRLTSTPVQTSQEGSPIPRVSGYVRVAGQILWATRFKENSSTTSSGGKGGPSTQTTNFTYTVSLAVALSEGVASHIGRVWADGILIDISTFTYRFYPGDEAQTMDPLIEEIEGTGNTPAYRGTCYIVFEDMDLTQFGNRIPQLQFELVRSLGESDATALENVLLGVNLIPGAGEFVYDTTVDTEDDGAGTTSSINNNNSSGVADVVSSLDNLQQAAPNIAAVSVVAGWFGDDLRAGSITIKPKVETNVKTTYPGDWVVDGINRASAAVVSQIDGIPAYGGTPTDASVVSVIQNLKTRSLRVNFYPFLFMDIAAGNSLPDPYSNNATTTGQPTYPWRGRITCSPAPGFTGSPDKTSTAATQVTNFYGAATASDFSVSGTTVSWTGGTDWGFRRMILHYAKLCVAAGGVDAFIIGSELVALNRVRSASTTFPSVAALKTLAADVKAIVGSGCKVGYAADWSEYNGYQTGDAAGAFQFHLDPLWSDSHIDFIGIDNYMPLSDWRDSTDQLDYNAVTGPTDIHDISYLQANIKGGEDYDWFYASQADRDSQTRTTITDGLGKPWVFRSKDLWNWWSNLHYDRVSGTESGTSTSWVAEGKPIWFTELGCPAVDKGSNQPNVFVDPKSSESAVPYYSNGQRDDLIQRCFLEAHLNYWTVSANNPTSTVYSAPMVDTNNILVWCWDARPFPFFPDRTDLWGDAGNYQFGHWLNGRLGAVMLADLVKDILDYQGFSGYDVSDLVGIVTGFNITDTMSARDAIVALATAYFFDAVESQGVVKFIMRGRPTTTAITEDDLVIDLTADPTFGYTLDRTQEEDLPVASNISFLDPNNSYQQGSTITKRLIGSSSRVATSTLPIVMDQSQAIAVGDQLIMDAWQMREAVTLSLAPSFVALDPTDELSAALGSRNWRFRITGVNDLTQRDISGVSTDPSIYDRFVGPSRASRVVTVPKVLGRDLLVFLDIPILTSADIPWAPHLASFANPWPGTVLLYRSATTSGYAVDSSVTNASSIGLTTNDFYSGPTNRWDGVNELDVQLYSGTLSSADDITVLDGANVLAIQNSAGGWEIVQFANATLIAPGTYKLTRLLRGQLGTEAQMGSPVSAGARVVVMDATILQSSISQSQYALPFNYLWGPIGKDISDQSYQGASLQFAGVGMLPYSPCHITWSWDNTGDLTLYWIRRDRDPASDSWDQTEIPMSEASEAYEIDIKNGSGTVLRTITGLTVTSYLYPAASQVADFSAQLEQGDTLHLSIYQISATVGRGTGKTVALNL